MKHRQKTSPEFRAELLKERIYATLALLAVLFTIDPSHTPPLKAAAIIACTALTLWAASLVASGMSYRVIMQEQAPEWKIRQQFVLHSPLLLAAAFPLLTVMMAASGFTSLSTAIVVAIAASLLLLLSWSLLSARAMKAGRLATLVLTATELAIGLTIVSLKLIVNH